MADPEAQQLISTDFSVNLMEALAARIKDPLWFLARQWQSGEFQAENGGKPALIRYEALIDPFADVTIGNGSKITITGAEPLEALVEAETPDGAAPAWESTQLDYGFKLASKGRKFSVSDYTGKGLDWHHFEWEKDETSANLLPETVTMTPNQIHFRGAPHPRWWRFEDSDEDFDSAKDAEPNVLSMLLPEFFFIDINNWYIIPAPMPSGSLREMKQLTVVDSFGVATNLGPASSPDWSVFSLGGPKGRPAGDSLMMAPNIALDVVENDVVEDIRFVRDEGANLVWAFEQLYQLPDGTKVQNGDGGTRSRKVKGRAGTAQDFRLSSETMPAWIPYVPRQIPAPSGPAREMRLRRGRTVESATLADPQHKSKLVGETRYLNEEEIPKTGLRIRRVKRYARGSDGATWFWIGRFREAGRTSHTPNLAFDYLED